MIYTKYNITFKIPLETAKTPFAAFFLRACVYVYVMCEKTLKTLEIKFKVIETLAYPTTILYYVHKQAFLRICLVSSN